jgi:outer membrane lipopolysaccharide assembly protein LptE/RlpB
MSRVATWLILIAAAVGLVAGCGFGLADDTGKPIPSGYWKWVCADGGAPIPDAGCRPPVPADGDATPPDAR